MKSSFILTGLSPEQVKLGRLVTDIWTPYNAYHDPDFISDPEVHEITQYSSKLYRRNVEQSSIGLKLSKLFGLNSDRRSNVFWRVEAESTTTQTLSNYSNVFGSMWGGGTTGPTNRTKEWIQHRFDGGEPVWMVVGIKTATNAAVTVDDSSDTSTSLDAGIPVSELASHGLSTLSGISALDIMIAMHVGKMGGVGEKYEVKGKCVIAVQYCKVRVGSWWKSQGDKATLPAGKIAWEWFIGNSQRTSAPSDSAPRGQRMLELALGEVAEMIRTNEQEGDQEHDDDDDDDIVKCFSVDGVELLF